MSIKAPKILVSPTFVFFSIAAILIVGLGFFAISILNPNTTNNIPNFAVMDSEIKEENGIQYVTVNAKNGFNPKTLNLKANTPTVLTVKTKNTYDCSNYLNIPEIKISKQLPVTGDTPINIPAQSPGTKMTATCGMGHYPLYLNFVNS